MFRDLMQVLMLELRKQRRLFFNVLILHGSGILIPVLIVPLFSPFSPDVIFWGALAFFLLLDASLISMIFGAGAALALRSSTLQEVEHQLPARPSARAIGACLVSLLYNLVFIVPVYWLCLQYFNPADIPYSQFYGSHGILYLAIQLNPLSFLLTYASSFALVSSFAALVLTAGEWLTLSQIVMRVEMWAADRMSVWVEFQELRFSLAFATFFCVALIFPGIMMLAPRIERMGKPGWIGWIKIGILVAVALILAIASFLYPMIVSIRQQTQTVSSLY